MASWSIETRIITNTNTNHNCGTTILLSAAEAADGEAQGEVDGEAEAEVLHKEPQDEV